MTNLSAVGEFTFFNKLFMYSYNKTCVNFLTNDNRNTQNLVLHKYGYICNIRV